MISQKLGTILIWAVLALGILTIAGVAFLLCQVASIMGISQWIPIGFAIYSSIGLVLMFLTYPKSPRASGDKERE